MGSIVNVEKRVFAEFWMVSARVEHSISCWGCSHTSTPERMIIALLEEDSQTLKMLMLWLESDHPQNVSGI